MKWNEERTDRPNDEEWVNRKIAITSRLPVILLQIFDNTNNNNHQFAQSINLFLAWPLEIFGCWWYFLQKSFWRILMFSPHPNERQSVYTFKRFNTWFNYDLLWKHNPHHHHRRSLNQILKRPPRNFTKKIDNSTRGSRVMTCVSGRNFWIFFSAIEINFKCWPLDIANRKRYDVFVVFDGHRPKTNI